jgi:hypothetical protein
MKRFISRKHARLIVMLALVALVANTCVAASALHHHKNAASEKTCQLCHFARLRIVTPHPQPQLSRPKPLDRIALRTSAWNYLGPAAFSVSPRAPPR